MNKLTIAVVALVFAVLGGCASIGDMVGTNAGGFYDASSPFPYGDNLALTDD
jgi:K+-transporting ATPase A subunit